MIKFAKWWLETRPIRTVRQADGGNIVDKVKATNVIGGALAASGVAAVLDKDIVNLVPDEYKGYVILVTGLVVVAARVRREVRDLWREFKASQEA